MSLLSALDPNGNPQIAATPLMPREKVTSCKLGKTRIAAMKSFVRVSSKVTVEVSRPCELGGTQRAML